MSASWNGRIESAPVDLRIERGAEELHKLPWWWHGFLWLAPRLTALFGALTLFKMLGVIP